MNKFRIVLYVALWMGLSLVIFLTSDKSWNFIRGNAFFNEVISFSSNYGLRNETTGRKAWKNPANADRTFTLPMPSMRGHFNPSADVTDNNNQDDDDGMDAVDKGISMDENSSMDVSSKYLPLCTRDEIINGKWVQDKSVTKAPYITTTQHLRCFDNKEDYTKNWVDWQWRPKAQCDFTPWRADTFKQLFKYTNILIAGDSLSWEQYSSLSQLLGHHIHQGMQHHSRELSQIVTIHMDDINLSYRRDDKLESLHEYLLQDDESVPFPTVLVLNRGAHHVNDTLLLDGIKQNIKAVKDWYNECDTRGVTCRLFWRTSVPGHPNCGNFTKPVNNRQEMEDMISDPSLYDERSITYRWDDYQHQNKLVLKELSKSKLPFDIIDAYYLNVLRPDQHRSHQGDCLHNCYPGKMDVYNQLLLHYVRNKSIDSTDSNDMKKAWRKYKWDAIESTQYDKVATMKAKEIRLKKGRSKTSDAK